MKKSQKLSMNSTFSKRWRTSLFGLVHFFMFALLITTHGHVQAQKDLSYVLTQDQAVLIALRDNPNLAQIRSRFAALSEVPSQVGTLPDPTISLNAMNFPTNSFDRDQEPMTQLQLGFSQMIPFPGKLSLREEATEFDAVAAGHQVEDVRWQLRRQVINKWWQVHFGDRHVEVNLPQLGEHLNKTAIIVDDVISSGQTILQCIKALQANGIRKIQCAAVHGIFAEGADGQLLAAGLDALITTNTIQHSSNAVDVTGLLIAPVEACLHSTISKSSRNNR